MRFSFKSLLFTTGLFSVTTLTGMRSIADNAHSPGHSHGGMDHDHQPIEIPQGQAVPQVDLVVHSDAVQGWNLEVKVSNFEFTPSHVNQADQLDEGHAHLYINGEKVTRIYGNWYYLKNLEPGENQLRVTLNTNGHQELYYQGQPIEDTETIRVP
jgi:hypothetical protein